jgi:hypothetical protein
MSVDKMPADEMKGCQIIDPKVIFFAKIKSQTFVLFWSVFSEPRHFDN